MTGITQPIIVKNRDIYFNIDSDTELILSTRRNDLAIGFKLSIKMTGKPERTLIHYYKESKYVEVNEEIENILKEIS